MTTKRFCRRCQANFQVPDERQDCPQCGQQLTAGLDMSTLELPHGPQAEWTGSSPPDETGDDFVDSRFDKYHIQRFLGRGGMARVYLARDLALERPCAIKILRRAEEARDQHSVETFLDEARAAAALVHPHVVTIHTIGEDRGQQFIEMEFIAGCSLARYVESAGGLDPLAATRLMLQISSALAAAHEMGMVHRDIKPANVMVTRELDAKLADFGLAKRLTTRRASAGMISGTPSFMAPELFAGRRAQKQSDIYAMGVTYFTLLTSDLPIAATSIGELLKFHTAPAPPDLLAQHHKLPAEVADVLRTCLARDPGQRYEDARELHEALRAVFGTLRSLKTLLYEALADEDVEIEGADDRFLITVALADGRSQTVHVEIANKSVIDEQLVRIFSVSAPANSEDYGRALELNATIPHGAIAVETIGGQRYFVVVNTYPRATCDPEEVRSSVMTIAAHADDIERRLGWDE